MALFRSRKIRMAAKNVSHQERRVSPAESARMRERASELRVDCRRHATDGRFLLSSYLIRAREVGQQS